MKKIFIITLLISTACSLGAQKTKGIPQNLTGKDLSQHYLQKSSHQKAGAFILMAGGLAVGILGGLNTIDFMESDRDKSGAYTMIGIGAASFIASFPLFISASKNKIRAMMAIRTQQINVPSSTSLRQTGIGLLIPLDL